MTSTEAPFLGTCCTTLACTPNPRSSSQNASLAPIHNKILVRLASVSDEGEHEPFLLSMATLLRSDASPLTMMPMLYRICPGRVLADTSVYLAVTSILSVFNISKAKDESGNIIEPPVGQTSGTIR